MSSTALARPLMCSLFLLSALLAQSPVQAQVQTAPQRFQVKQFEISGNTLLAAGNLEAALAPYQGEHTLAELKQAAKVVQELYRQAGYGAVVVYLPEQDISSGRITLAVLEGRLAKVVLSGNTVFSETNIRRSLPRLQSGSTPQVRAIDVEVRLANENPAKQIAVTLEAGQQPGAVDAQVVVTEQAPVRWAFGLDNTGNANTGRLRSSLSLQHAALWDLDHQVALQLQVSPDKPAAVKIYSIDYRVPLYAQGLIFDGFAAYSNIDGGTTSTAAGPLQFNGRGRMWSLRLSRPLQRSGETDQRLALSLNERAYLNNCSIADLPDACGTAGASVTVRPLVLEYSAQLSHPHALSLNAVLSHNLPWGGAHTSSADFEAARAGATRNYTTLRLDMGAAEQLGAWRLQSRWSGQWSRQALVPGEQFGLAGSNAVRGYEEREVVGDQGANVTLELLGPELAPILSESLRSTRLLGFVDAGKVWNQFDGSGNTTNTPCLNEQLICSLASVGAGLRLNAGGLQFRLDLAHALRNAPRTARGDNRVHLLASYGF
ncbi:MAG: ShlB/FhaC/HecB family hemolysin secretion/activation protein [Leptothrix sp. (in: b-proteobacteria)]